MNPSLDRNRSNNSSRPPINSCWRSAPVVHASITIDSWSCSDKGTSTTCVPPPVWPSLAFFLRLGMCPDATPRAAVRHRPKWLICPYGWVHSSRSPPWSPARQEARGLSELRGIGSRGGSELSVNVLDVRLHSGPADAELGIDVSERLIGGERASTWIAAGVRETRVARLFPAASARLAGDGPRTVRRWLSARHRPIPRRSTPAVS